MKELADKRRGDSRDQGPMARLQARISDPDTPGAILQLCAAGYRIEQIARQWGVPKAKFLAWIAGNADLHEQCLRVRQLVAHELAAEGLEIVDEVKDAQEPERIAAGKLRAEYRLKMARAFHPRVYGEQKQVDITHRRDMREYTDEQLQAIVDAANRRRAAEEAADAEVVSDACSLTRSRDGDAGGAASEQESNAADEESNSADGDT